MILDYNKSKSGVDKLDQQLKEYRSYRVTSRWPCVVFYDLLGFTTIAAWVLYYLKFPDCGLVKRKNRKEFLYQLGKQLCNPLILHRTESPGFKYCKSALKSAISSSAIRTQSDSLEKNPTNLQTYNRPEHSNCTERYPGQSISPELSHIDNLMPTSSLHSAISPEIQIEIIATHKFLRFRFSET